MNSAGRNMNTSVQESHFCRHTWKCALDSPILDTRQTNPAATMATGHTVLCLVLTLGGRREAPDKETNAFLTERSTSPALLLPGASLAGCPSGQGQEIEQHRPHS